MPRLVRRDTLQLCLLLLVVPVQFWLSHEFRQPRPIIKTVMEYMDVCHSILEVYSTKIMSIIPNYISTWVSSEQGDSSLLEDESPAKEVLEYRNQQSNLFASSNAPRYSRSPDVHFRIGDVVMHKHKKLRGVVVGWDYKAQAPPEYIKEYYTPIEANQPNYLVAIDTRDRLNPQFTYTPDNNLELLTNVRVIHPNLDDYFEFYDGNRFIPRPWLQAIYPKD